MRIYLPATLDELDPAAPLLTGRRAHAVTTALRAALPDEDEEGLEFVAQLEAADLSLELLARDPGAPRLRLVVSADVPETSVGAVEDDDAPPSAVDVLQEVVAAQIVCFLVDEPAASEDVALAAAGDAAALERLEEADLLWYDASELGAVPRP
ncbi:DUF6912 family protein [Cellulomonas alba]|uniref:Uncharacterized protein n=1 Tax=Cellulomonas alba TaxID=3053467 RepID=A0ABT7SCQ5_9CELL|nr:hypothetical protein [Cellulomonas alba]MDM7853976.1 hypothetical protein [Cellulomonas alba]